MNALTSQERVDAFIASMRKRSDNWGRDELLILAERYFELGPKGASRLLPKRSHKAVGAMALRMGLTSGVPRGRRPDPSRARAFRAQEAA